MRTAACTFHTAFTVQGLSLCILTELGGRSFCDCLAEPRMMWEILNCSTDSKPSIKNQHPATFKNVLFSVLLFFKGFQAVMIKKVEKALLLLLLDCIQLKCITVFFFFVQVSFSHLISGKIFKEKSISPKHISIKR